MLFTRPDHESHFSVRNYYGGGGRIIKIEMDVDGNGLARSSSARTEGPRLRAMLRKRISLNWIA
jgi:hypothetical protein